MGDLLMKGLLVVYLIIAVVYLFERNMPKAMYWISAFGITFSVLWGMK